MSRRAATGLIGRLLMRPPRRRTRTNEAARLADARSFTVTSGGRPLAAWSWGVGPTVLLVHGWGASAAQMTPLVAPLVAAGRRVVAFDSTAHGASPGCRSSVVHMARAVTDVAAVVGDVDAVVAHSAGAAATTLALARGVDARRVAYLAPALRPGGFLRRILRRLRLDRHVTHATQAWLERRVGATFEALHRDVATPAALPLLVVHDVGDRIVPIVEGRDLVDGWPGAHLVETSGLGHSGAFADAAIATRVVAFVCED